MTKLLTLFCTLSILIGCGRQPDQQGKKEFSERPLTYVLDSLQLEKEDLSILIDKSDYKLYVRTDSIRIKEYPVVFGTNPIDDKLMQGDRSTPEGHFKVCEFYPHKSWSKFIWIDYPTANSWEKHNSAKSEHKIPKDAKIGGEIGIHGVPDNNSSLIRERINWTWGCISLTNEDVGDLYSIVYKGMEIEITK
ncbi:L,D-transpeptidase [Maribacter sp.]|nr:L,D-transpeptidase [Maribacter sp.]